MSTCHNSPSINSSCAFQNRPSNAELLTYTMTVQTQCLSFQFKFLHSISHEPSQHHYATRSGQTLVSYGIECFCGPHDAKLGVDSHATPFSSSLARANNYHRPDPDFYLKPLKNNNNNMGSYRIIFIKRVHVTVAYLSPPLLLLLRENQTSRVSPFGSHDKPTSPKVVRALV